MTKILHSADAVMKIIAVHVRNVLVGAGFTPARPTQSAFEYQPSVAAPA